MDASHVYVRAWALGCFYSHSSTGTFRRALAASLDSCAEKKTAPSGVTKSGSLEEGAGKRYSECDRDTLHRPEVCVSKEQSKEQRFVTVTGFVHLTECTVCSVYRPGSEPFPSC